MDAMRRIGFKDAMIRKVLNELLKVFFSIIIYLSEDFECCVCNFYNDCFFCLKRIVSVFNQSIVCLIIMSIYVILNYD